MAWRSSGVSNATLIANLVENGLITSDRVRRAMLAVDRAHYAPSQPYQDSPQSIGHAATISAPHMHASACETLLPHLQPGSTILDIGSGSGYLTHVLAELVKPSGKVIGVDHLQVLVDLANKNISNSVEGRALIESGAVEFVKGDGRLGFPTKAPYDAIHVGAAAASLHASLVDQLKQPGRLFVPVEDLDGNGDQYIFVIDKKADGTVEHNKLYGVRYVPLTDEPCTSKYLDQHISDLS